MNSDFTNHLIRMSRLYPRLLKGSRVECEVVASDLTTGSFFVTVPYESELLTGVLSWYEVPDELFESIIAGTRLTAAIDRLENGSFVLMEPVEALESKK